MKDDFLARYFFLGIAGTMLVIAVGTLALFLAPVAIAGWVAYKLTMRHLERKKEEAKIEDYEKLYARAKEITQTLPDDLTRMATRAILSEHDTPPSPVVLSNAVSVFCAIGSSDHRPSLPNYDPSPWGKAKVIEFIAYWEKAAENHKTLLVQTAIAITNVTTELPQVEDKEGFLTLTVPYMDSVDDASFLVRSAIDPFFAEELVETGMGQWLRNALDENLCRVSGIPFRELHTSNKEVVLPSRFKGTARECVSAYLSGTALYKLFDFDVNVTVPHSARFEHMHLVAGTGHGKTQTIQQLIAYDLERVARGEASIVVIDSQGDLIRNVSRLAVFGNELKGKLTLIDPSDIEYPPALNLFDVNMERIQTYSPLERERMVNSIIELYDFVFAGLLGAELTSKQSTVFRYVLRLLLHIPNATIHTLRELFEPDGYEKYREHIAKLSRTPRAFFETEFQSREFHATKQQVLRRLWGVLENQTFERMFSHPRNKLDFKAEMDSGQVILINTTKALLKQSGTEILGRFFIAMIAQAAQERASQSHRMPTYVYIDEAGDYFDQNIEVILREARKYNVGILLAHQYLGQLDPKLQQAFAANTAIKMAGGVSDKDARQFAHDMRCDPSFILAQPKGHFALYAKGTTPTAMRYRTEFGVLEGMPRLQDFKAIRGAMRERYSVQGTSTSTEPDMSDASLTSSPAAAEERSPDGENDGWRS